MSDVVDRLRNGHPDLRGDDYTLALIADRKNALAEIERLRTALEKAGDAASFGDALDIICNALRPVKDKT